MIMVVTHSYISASLESKDQSIKSHDDLMIYASQKHKCVFSHSFLYLTPFVTLLIYSLVDLLLFSLMVGSVL